MKTLFLVLLPFLIFKNINGQNNKYLFPHKEKDFSQLDWLEIMSELANDSQTLALMKNNSSGSIQISNKPYVAYVNEEHPIVLQFCPECIWTVDTCISNCNIGTISVSALGDYNFHINNVTTQDIWNSGDTLGVLLYVVHTSKTKQNKISEVCTLIPIACNIQIPAYPIFPNKKKRR